MIDDNDNEMTFDEKGVLSTQNLPELHYGNGLNMIVDGNFPVDDLLDRNKVDLLIKSVEEKINSGEASLEQFYPASEKKIDSDELKLANGLKVKVSISEILAENYKDHRFNFKGHVMSPYEVFASDGFFPIFHYYANTETKNSFGFEIKSTIDIKGKDEGSIFGQEVVIDDNNSSDQLFLYLTRLFITIDRIIGRYPSKVNLVPLYEFAFKEGQEYDEEDSDELRIEYPPFVGTSMS